MPVLVCACLLVLSLSLRLRLQFVTHSLTLFVSSSLEYLSSGSVNDLFLLSTIAGFYAGSVLAESLLSKDTDRFNRLIQTLILTIPVRHPASFNSLEPATRSLKIFLSLFSNCTRLSRLHCLLDVSLFLIAPLVKENVPPLRTDARNLLRSLHRARRLTKLLPSGSPLFNMAGSSWIHYICSGLHVH